MSIFKRIKNLWEISELEQTTIASVEGSEVVGLKKEREVRPKAKIIKRTNDIEEFLQ